ncbi:MAG: restriction endonuclease subunit S [Dehalococcoidia bacterium]
MDSAWPIATIEELKASTPNALAMGPFGSNIKTDNFVPQGVPVIRGNNLKEGRFEDDKFVYLTEDKADQLRNANALPGDLVFTHRGTLGQVGIIPKTAQHPRYVVSQSQMKLTCDTSKIDPLFLYYYFRSAVGQHALLSNASTTGVPALSRPLTSLRQIEVPVPPLSEQRAIAAILGTLDDKIELNRRMNETLEAIARAIFKSWFVDFDPVRAKMAGREPVGMDAETAALFPDTFEDSPLGKIPMGWGTHPLGDVLSLDKGLSYKGQFLTEHGVPMVNLGCFLGRGRFSEKAIKKYSGEYKSRHVVRPRDLVLANTDITQHREVIGSPALVPPQGDLSELIFSHHVFAARFHEGTDFWKMFVYFLLLQDDFRARAAGFATGTTVLALPRDAVLNVRFPGAPRALVTAFAEVALPILERGWKSAEESRTLATVRDTLLPKLLSGEVRVKDAQLLSSGAG